MGKGWVASVFFVQGTLKLLIYNGILVGHGHGFTTFPDRRWPGDVVNTGATLYEKALQVGPSGVFQLNSTTVPDAHCSMNLVITKAMCDALRSHEGDVR